MFFFEKNKSSASARLWFVLFRTVFSLCLKMSPICRLVNSLTEILTIFSKPVLDHQELLIFAKNLQSDELFSPGNYTHSSFNNILRVITRNGLAKWRIKKDKASQYDRDSEQENISQHVFKYY